jgi:glycerate 2-kinase
MIRINRHRLRAHPFHEDQLLIMEAALAAIDPGALMANRLSINGDVLETDGLRVLLTNRRIWIVSIGKAAVPMAQAAESLVGTERIAGGVAVTRKGCGGSAGVVRVIEAGHPIPESTAGADAISELSSQVRPEDLVLCLLSGGGSALLASPPRGISMPELARTTDLLLHSGAPIDEVNTVRRHVARLQGGQLMSRLHPATVITLVLSDVIGDRLEAIASGPTVPDPSSFTDARDVLQRYQLWDRIPESIRFHILSGIACKIDDTPKPGDPIFETAHTITLGNNGTAVSAMGSAAQALGFAVHVLPDPMIGEARDVGFRLADQALQLAGRADTRWAIVTGGETTVTVRGKGRGGRNQELALAAALRLEGVAGLSMAALATDGTDGPTDAAGALIDGETVGLARQRGLDPATALECNDSHAFLDATGDLLWTGPTRTNVADLVLILGEPRA